MIDLSRATRHERGVVLAALRQYKAKQDTKARTAELERTRAMAGANAFVAGDLLRQATTA